MSELPETGECYNCKYDTDLESNPCGCSNEAWYDDDDCDVEQPCPYWEKRE